MLRGCLFAVTIGVLTTCIVNVAVGQLREQSAGQQPALEETPSPPSQTPPPASATDQSPQETQEKLSRVWANEPPLVRLARDKFGAELTETDAKFFAAVADNQPADLRPTSKTTYNSEEPASWKGSPKLRADRLIWLLTDTSAVKLIPSRGVWLRGVHIQGKIDLFRCAVPVSLSIYDCLFEDGLNISHAKLEGLDIRNCCSAAVEARSVQITENVYLLTTCVFGGLDFIDAQIGGDFDFSGGFAFYGMSADDAKKSGIALNFHDAKIAGDLKLTDKFRALGEVRLIGANIGHNFCCQYGKFKSGGGRAAIDARNAEVKSNIQLTTGFRAEGSVVLRQAHVGGDLDCNGGRFIASTGEPQALDAEMMNVGGQINLGNGFHAEGEVRLINAVVGGDIYCINGHFLNPTGICLKVDGATIGRSLRLAVDNSVPTDSTKNLPPGFLSRGAVSLCGVQIHQDLIATGGQFEAPTGLAVMANNLRVGGRVDLTSVKVQGSFSLFAADIEHEIDLRCSQFDAKEAPNHIAIWANGMHVRGHVYCSQVETPEGIQRLHVNGLTSFQFATIAMHWDLTGAEFINSGDYALDASDCRVGGYVNLDHVLVDGSATFSRAKIDGMWILQNVVEPQKMRLDLRFAHIWVIKDEKLEDWPPAGQLQLEGLVYDHFDDDSPLDVNDRLAWLRRQYAPIVRHGFKFRHGSPRPAATSQLRVPRILEALGQSPLHVKETDGRDSTVVPTQYEAATMPAPQTPAPTMTPTPSPTPQERYQPHPMVVTAEEAGAKSNTNNVASSLTDDTTAKDAASSEAPAASDTPSAATAAAPDPFGRRYITQPYTQLASVYRAIGQDEQANDVLVARAERIGELAAPFSAQGLWYGYLGRLIGYGYEPFRAIKIGLVIIAVGAVVFALGSHRNLMSETNLAERVLSKEDESGVVSPTYPRFNAIIYSLDVFLPFVDLNQVGYWIPGERLTKPRTSRNCFMHVGRYSLKWSSMLHAYLWFQTLAGWTLCTLLAAAVTGIVQS